MYGASQVFPDVDRDAFLRAFEKHGNVTDYTFISRSDTAFVDFESARDAAAAKEALDGVMFDGHRIRIEFKDEWRGPPPGTARRFGPGYEGVKDCHVPLQSSPSLDTWVTLQLQAPQFGTSC